MDLSRLSHGALVDGEREWRREHGINPRFPSFSELLGRKLWWWRGAAVAVLCGANGEEKEEDGCGREELKRVRNE